jgi:hypothetical protein
MRKFLVIALIATIAATTHGMFLEKGTSEISVSGLLDFDSASGTLTDLNLFYGYFFMDYLEVGLAGSYLNDDAVRAFALGPKAEYNFDIGYSVVPFVGASLKFASVDFKDTDKNDTCGIAGVEAGAKFFITEYAAISAALVGELASEDIYSAKDGMDSTDIRAELGMRIFF